MDLELTREEEQAINSYQGIGYDEINEWITSHDVYTKAGAYAIQEGFGKYIKKIDGDYFSIVGFPIHKLYNLLKKYNK